MKYNEFNIIHNQKVNEITNLFKKQKNFREKLAKHNYGYLDFDFTRYFRQSSIRYYQALKLLNFPENKKVLDIGGFFGLFALDIKKLNNKITIAEKYDYYDNYFENIKNHLINNGIRIIDKDFVLENYKGREKYDIITCMALLEHLSSSPSILFENIKKMLAPGGILIIDVPNLAYLKNRLGLIFGKSILSDIRHIYRSDVPFTGHLHEYTVKEFDLLAKEAGMKVEKIITFNYSVNSLTSKILHIPTLFIPDSKDTIMVKLIK